MTLRLREIPNIEINLIVGLRHVVVPPRCGPKESNTEGQRRSVRREAATRRDGTIQFVAILPTATLKQKR